MSLKKIVSANEMARIEQESIEEGYKADIYMEFASKNIAEEIDKFVSRENKNKKGIFLIGKGNNGGDGLACALFLLKKGYDLKIYYLFEPKDCSLLNRKYFRLLSDENVILKKFETEEDFKIEKESFIVDALLGIGFYGQLEQNFISLIELVNKSRLPILSIDVPSGLDATSGLSDPICIKAHTTFYLELPKIGFFLREGYESVGKLVRVEFGLNKKYEDRALAEGMMLLEDDLSSFLPEVKRTWHKYQKGYVVAIAGSKQMPGAAYLATLSAFRSGAGIVRLFYQEGMQESFSLSFNELIKTPLPLAFDDQTLKNELERASSLLIGPGLSREKKILDFSKSVLENYEMPTLIDADALIAFKDCKATKSKNIILTPHHREMEELLGINKKIEIEDFYELCQGFVEEHKVILVLKGAPTIIFESKKPFVLIAKGDPAMATAGSGDVLSGILAALLSMGVKCKEAAIIGVYIHDLCGELAAKEKSSFSVMASDLIEQIPNVYLMLEKK